LAAMAAVTWTAVSRGGDDDEVVLLDVVVAGVESVLAGALVPVDVIASDNGVGK
jgi:hypothetical protein